MTDYRTLGLKLIDWWDYMILKLAQFKSKPKEPANSIELSSTPSSRTPTDLSLLPINFSQYTLPVLLGPELKSRAEAIIGDCQGKYDSQQDYIKMLSLVDYTTLEVTDTTTKIDKMLAAVNSFDTTFPDLDNVAALCVYPSFVERLKIGLRVPDLKLACVAGGFPASQIPLKCKLAEVHRAVKDGADEVDIVLPVGKLLERRWAEVKEEIAALKTACGKSQLKVILEVDALKDPKLIFQASLLAMQAGADFLKTSTGKYTRDSAAFETHVLIMCEAMKIYKEQHSVTVGIKPAGSIRTPEQAPLYLYTLVSETLGTGYQDRRWFRLGASSLANALLTKIKGKEEAHFPYYYEHT